MRNSNYITGVIGGLGNEAMVDLANKITTIPGYSQRSWIFFGNSRLAYKPHEIGLEPEALIETERRRRDTARHTSSLMRHLGCGSMGLACNSAHELFREVMLDIRADFVDMIEETARSMAPARGRALIMGVTSLIESGLYQTALQQRGLETAEPSADNQAKVMDAIYNTEFGIKTGKITRQSEELLCSVLSEECRGQDCGQVVLACTEIPLALAPERCAPLRAQGLLPEEVAIIDASTVLAKSLVAAPCAAPESETPPPKPEGATDWFPPLAFKVDSIQAMVALQQDIFERTAAHLATQGRSVTGSYMHLPTLFLVGDTPHAIQRLAELGVDVLPPDAPRTEETQAKLEAHFASMA